MSGFRDVISRRRQELVPITTSLAPQHHLPTPASAAGLSSHFNYGQSQHQGAVAYTPISTTREYNPQQWNGGTGNTVRYSPQQAAEIPPPYSPPRSNRPSTISPQEPSPSTLPVAHRVSPATANPRISPDTGANPMFPPPPGTGPRNRGASRDRGAALFNLSFGRNRQVTDPERSPEVTRDQPIAPARRAAPAPISIAPIQVEQVPVVDTRPPAARRSASTGGIDTPSHSRSRANSGAQWAPGMPLPPPPPGPPPQPSSRSQSLTRAPDNSAHPPTRRPQAVSSLGPVPPTPADWVDEDAAATRQSLSPPPPMPSRGLQLDTSNRGLSLNTTNLGINTPADSVSESAAGSGSAGLSRAHAVRGEPKSIRERRSESRTGRTAHPDEQSNNPWAEAVTPSDITVPPMTILGRRPTITRGTPRSARSMQNAEGPNSARSLGTPSLLGDGLSRDSTPRPLNSARRPEAPTPPFSPDQYDNTSQYASPLIPPKSLPTPPPQSRSSFTQSRPSSHGYNRSISEAMSQPHASPALLTPRALASVQSGPADKFSQDSIRRHSDFAEREAAAENDEARVRLFAEFIVAESRLRRQRYATAIDAMGSEILELTRDLFRPYTAHQRGASNSLSSAGSSKPEVTNGRLTPQSGSRPGSRQDNATTPASAGPSPSHSSSGRPDSAWFNTYMPSLSPIESVAQSSKADESSSRGRPSSRWWEVDENASSGSQGGRIERSKRESKYMGQLREQLQWDENGTPSLSGTPRGTTTAGSSSQTSYSANEYPPEKVGWHEEAPTVESAYKSPTHLSYQQQPYSPALPTPTPLPNNTKHLDVSRLVTLPPPYPRHHPAVNNNHPDLSAIRIQVRGLTDFVEVEATKARFLKGAKSLLEENNDAAAKRRSSFRADIHRGIESGTMSYADAATSEAAFKKAEQDISKAQTKASYELFQASVVNPLNDLLMDRINLATSLSESLKDQITLEAASGSHNATQEEGDEQPELLEKLTLLKWIFEACESLHREVFELVGERNDRYKEMVTMNYRFSGNLAKTEEAERFFAADANKRAVDYEKESVARTVAFMDGIESHVVRGVEMQLSAFWDIAPGLNEVLEKIPKDITHGFGVVIPNEEYEDNPSYKEHPLQYLWTLLEHSEKSAYQFMESQTNLLCLLHEVKSTVSAAKGRVEDAQCKSDSANEDAEVVNARLESVKEERTKEERRLTEDLKERVRVVEDLWGSSLGREMDEVKERVREVLVEQGGWEGLQNDE